MTAPSPTCHQILSTKVLFTFVPTIYMELSQGDDYRYMWDFYEDAEKAFDIVLHKEKRGPMGKLHVSVLDDIQRAMTVLKTHKSCV